MNSKEKQVIIVRNPFKPFILSVREMRFFTLVFVGYKMNAGEIYSGCALSGRVNIYSKLETYIMKRFPEFGLIH